VRARVHLIVVVIVGVLATMPTAMGTPLLSGDRAEKTDRRSREGGLPDGFVPAAVAAQQGLNRYFVEMKAPAVADRVAARGRVSGAQQRATSDSALASQRGAIRAVEARGGQVVFRYSVLVNAFSARMSPAVAAQLRGRSDVASVAPVAIVRKHNETSVPFIGATAVWEDLNVRGQGMRVAVVDTGIDYTHKAFGGPGTVRAYQRNDPDFIEPGSFPTAKVIGGFDFVGGNYDVLDGDSSNDTPRPDFDPLDRDGHGTHTAGTCCGNGVPGVVGRGVAPRSRLYAFKVWDVGNSTDDVLVAAYERAVDPNQNGDVSDQVDVLSFSGGVDYGTLNSLEARAAQRVVDLGTVFVASAGNSGGQPVGLSAYITGTPANTRGVISVAASIDQFVAQTISVNDPPGVDLPDNGIIVHQDWSADIPADITNDVLDAREFDPPADPDGDPAPSDQQFCSAVPGNHFNGAIALVFKGSTGAGDCDGSAKVFFAQEAGASAVVLWSGFGGLPFGLGPGAHADEITIPAVMVSTADGAVLGDAASPNAPAAYNTGGLNVTIDADTSAIPGFDDAMTDFTSEGPARVTSDLKPDVSAPGFDITSAAVGTGTGASVLSGTSMSAPHVSGVATLLRQIHPSWSPKAIKALIMNQAKRAMKNNDLTEPVPATLMGAGRVRAWQSARASSVAAPGSLSFGLQEAPGQSIRTRLLKVSNFGNGPRGYTVSGNVRYTDHDPAIADIRVSLNGQSFADSRSFSLDPGERRRVWIRLRLDPSVISPPEQEFGWFYFHPNVDGTVRIQQTGGRGDVLRVPWHVAPLARSKNAMNPSALDLTDGSGTMRMASPAAAGFPYGDLYLLGATDGVESTGEEDLLAVGARSFTGSLIDGQAEGVPTGTEPLAGLTWQEFLTNDDEPTEPVEFGVHLADVFNITETLEVDVLVDAGADGVFADEDLQADYLIVKLAAPGGQVCVFDLSAADPFAECSALYFADYNNYNSSVTGLVVDAQEIGLSNLQPELSYMVLACTGRFSGDVPGQFCDTAGGFDSGTGTYTARLHATDPALQIDPLVCQGFFGGGDCNAADPIDVTVGSAQPGDNPSILALFPNNPSRRSGQIITTET
jgi:subtilisin family serine protease